MIHQAMVVSLVVMLSATCSSYAGEVKSITDKLYSDSFDNVDRPGKSFKGDSPSCEIDNTALITIFSENGMAKNSIDVSIDGKPVGSLTSYFPDEKPGCNTPSARGIITIKLPAGKHTLEATSIDVNWPSHSFTVEKCECKVLPLS